ncbi:MAG: hypothetical protein D6683_04060 [Actinomyces sp.]|nr:MAG: hypothetical protein D6683_04060 [Actinomyces sp.]
MTVTLVGTPTSTGLKEVTSFTFSHTVPAGQADTVLVVDVGARAAHATAVTFAGQSLTKVVGDTTGTARMSTWVLVNPPTGAGTVSVTLSALAGFVVAGARTFAGVDQSTPAPTSASNAGTSNAPSVDVAFGELEGGLVVDAVYLNAQTNTLTPTSGTTDWSATIETQPGRGAHRTPTTTGTFTAGWTAGKSGSWSCTAIVLRPSAAHLAEVAVAGSDTAVGSVTANLAAPLEVGDVLLVAGTVTGSDEALLVATATGVTFTVQAGAGQSTFETGIRLFSGEVTSGGATSVTLTRFAGSAPLGLVVAVYRGYGSSPTFSATATASADATGTIQSVTHTATADNDPLLGAGVGAGAGSALIIVNPDGSIAETKSSGGVNIDTVGRATNDAGRTAGTTVSLSLTSATWRSAGAVSFNVGGGGTNYTRTAAETVTPADAGPQVATTGRAGAETTAPTDSGSQAATSVRAGAETTTPADAAAATLIIAATASETVTPTDAVSGSGSSARSAAETVTPTDAGSTTSTTARSGAETVTPTDATGGAHTASRTSTETVAPADTGSTTVTGGGTLTRTAAETVTPTDTVTGVSTTARSGAETVTPTDTGSQVATTTRAGAESVAPADGVVPVSGTVRSGAETVTPADAGSRAAAASRTTAETVGPTDGASTVLGGGTNHVRTAAETVGPTDTGSVVRQSARTAVESVTPTDVGSGTSTVSRSTGPESVTPTDTATPQVSTRTTRTAAESVTPTDTAPVSATSTRLAAESVAPADGASVSAAMVVLAAETLTPADILRVGGSVAADVSAPGWVTARSRARVVGVSAPVIVQVRRRAGVVGSPS